MIYSVLYHHVLFYHDKLTARLLFMFYNWNEITYLPKISHKSR